MKKKILFFHFDLQGGGAERVLVNIANNLSPEEYDITVQTVFGYGANKKYLAPHVRQKSLFACRSFRGMRQIFRLIPPKLLHKLLIHEMYDIEIAFLELIPTRIVGGCRTKGTRIYAWLHNTVSNGHSLACASWSLNELYDTYASFDKIAFVSEGVKEAFYKYYPVSTPGEVVHNVLETDFIVNRAKEDIDIALDESCLNLCSVGRICGQKGYDRLFRCLKRASEVSERKWHLYLIGAGVEKEPLIRQATDLGIVDKISFLGYQDNPYKYVAKMDLFVCSSLYEGYSTAVTESIVVGTPVLTTDCSGMSEIFGNTKAGFIVDNNEDALTDGLIEVFDNLQLLQQMKLDAVVRSNFYSKSACLKQFENFIKG